MDDIVQRLRRFASYMKTSPDGIGGASLVISAADEIERLRTDSGHVIAGYKMQVRFLNDEIYKLRDRPTSYDFDYWLHRLEAELRSTGEMSKEVVEWFEAQHKGPPPREEDGSDGVVF